MPGFLACLPPPAWRAKRNARKRAREEKDKQTATSRSSSERRKAARNAKIVEDGHQHLRNAHNILFEHRDSLNSQLQAFDKRWAHLYTVAPVLKKLTKGRQRPEEFYDNTENLLQDVQEALKRAHERRKASPRRRSKGLIPSYPPSIRSVARSITSRLSRIGDLVRFSPPNPRPRLKGEGALERAGAITRGKVTGRSDFRAKEGHAQDHDPFHESFYTGVGAGYSTEFSGHVSHKDHDEPHSRRRLTRRPTRPSDKHRRPHPHHHTTSDLNPSDTTTHRTPRPHEYYYARTPMPMPIPEPIPPPPAPPYRLPPVVVDTHLSIYSSNSSGPGKHHRHHHHRDHHRSSHSRSHSPSRPHHHHHHRHESSSSSPPYAPISRPYRPSSVLRPTTVDARREPVSRFREMFT